MIYHYERPLIGRTDKRRSLRPDFTFIDDAGDVIIWEHLGLLSQPDYQASWQWKKNWYASNGFLEGENLFTTSELGGLDMRHVENIADQVIEALT